MHPKNNTTRSDLIELLQVNKINLILSDRFDVMTNDTQHFLCVRCRRWSAENKDELCKRCEKIMEIIYSK